jgi:hypothetical protein
MVAYFEMGRIEEARAEVSGAKNKSKDDTERV